MNPMQITPLSNCPAHVQDWFTNLAWDQPQLFHILPCVYNAQTNIQLLRPPWEEVGCSTIELSTGLREISQCLEKAPTRALRNWDACPQSYSSTGGFQDI